MRFAELADGFSSAVAVVPDDGWDAPSPCEGWTARDVVSHVIETQRSFLTGHGVDLGAAPDPTAPAEAWDRHRSSVAAALADPAVAGRSYDGHFGPTTVGDTMVRFYGFDLTAHRWDVAAAAGFDWRFSDEDLDFLDTGADGFGPALYAEGICKPGVEAGDDADRQARVLAKLGRVSG